MHDKHCYCRYLVSASFSLHTVYIQLYSPLLLFSIYISQSIYCIYIVHQNGEHMTTHIHKNIISKRNGLLNAQVKSFIGLYIYQRGIIQLSIYKPVKYSNTPQQRKLENYTNDIQLLYNAFIFCILYKIIHQIKIQYPFQLVEGKYINRGRSEIGLVKKYFEWSLDSNIKAIFLRTPQAGLIPIALTNYPAAWGPFMTRH